MSYILDALRRADAERERGAVPGLHTQQFGALPDDDEAPPRSRLLIGTIVLLVLALGGVLSWNFLGGSEPAPKPVLQGQVTPSPPPVALAAPPPPAASTPTAIAAMPASAALPPAAARRPPPPPRPPVRRDPPATTPASPTAPAATAAAPGGTPPAGDRIYALAELPDAIRRELPKLAYGGGSYSGDKASRLAFLNGQVFHEGDTVAPGLVLRQIKQKGVILAYKGYRFELGA